MTQSSFYSDTPNYATDYPTQNDSNTEPVDGNTQAPSSFYPDGGAYEHSDPDVAANYAAQAAASAAAAAASDADAQTQAATATTQAANAASSATAAAGSASAASTSATAASGSASAASTSATNAGNSATAAAGSAGAASTSATNAANSATAASGSASAASTSAGNAATSATNAANSASAAATSATNAASAVQAAAGTATPLVDGTAAVGTSAKWAHEDHVHPTDTTRAPLVSPAFTGTPTAPTPTVGDNSTKVATTAFVLSNTVKVLTPEQFGAVGNGSTDDTAAFTALASAINTAAKGVKVEFGFGKNYRVWTTPPATQSVLVSLSGVNGLKINFNGSQITNPINFGTSNIILYWFLLLNCQNVEINGPSFDQVNYHTLDSSNGCHGIYLEDYCRSVRVNNLVMNGGIIGFGVVRSGSFNRSLRARDIFMSGDFTNVYYPANFQKNGDEVELRYRTRNAGRSYFVYNVRQHQVTLDSQAGGPFDDCLLKVYADPAESNGENTLSDINLHYSNLGRQVSNPNTGSLVRLGIDQATTTTAAGFLRNIKMTFEVDTGSFSNPPLVATTKATSTGASDTTARGHFISNIEFSGYINWGSTTTASLELFTNSGTESLGDFSGDTVEMITFRNFSLYGASAPFNLNAACIDRGLRFENCFITGTMNLGTIPQKLLDASANVSGTLKSFSDTGTAGSAGYQAYRRLPDGGIEIWGLTSATAGANTAVSFSLVFSAVPTVTCCSTAAGTASPVNAVSATTSGFSVNNPGASTVVVAWHAKGYI